jgi:hypothetical protein
MAGGPAVVKGYAGAGFIRFRSEAGRDREAFVIVRELGGRRVAAFALGPEEDRILRLAPGVYVSYAGYRGGEPVPAKFVVR